jgi:hypothetical protein
MQVLVRSQRAKVFSRDWVIVYRWLRSNVIRVVLDALPEQSCDGMTLWLFRALLGFRDDVSSLLVPKAVAVARLVGRGIDTVWNQRSCHDDLVHQLDTTQQIVDTSGSLHPDVRLILANPPFPLLPVAICDLMARNLQCNIGAYERRGHARFDLKTVDQNPTEGSLGQPRGTSTLSVWHKRPVCMPLIPPFQSPGWWRKEISRMSST